MLGTRAVLCPHCGNPATAEIRGRAVWDNYGDDGAPQGLPVEWTFTDAPETTLATVLVTEAIPERLAAPMLSFVAIEVTSPDATAPKICAPDTASPEVASAL